MAQTIKLKRSAVSGNTPSTSDLELGEIAINTYDGKVFIKKNDGSASVVEVGAADNTKLPLTGGTITGTVVFNSAPTFNTAIAMGSTLNVASSIGIAGTTVIDSSRNLTNIAALTLVGNITQGNGDYIYNGGGNFDIKHTTAGQNIVFSTTPSGGSTAEVLRITSTGDLAKLSGNLTLDVAGDINLDADSGSINFKDGGVSFGSLFKSSSNMILYSSISNGDMKFQGVDGGSNITALTLDMSTGGTAYFADDVRLTDNHAIRLGTDGDIVFYHDNSNGYLESAGNFTLDVAGDIKLDSDSGSWRFQDGGGSIIELSVGSGSSPTFYSAVSNADIVFRGNDGGSAITALTLDMSEGGSAVFANNVTVSGNLEVTGTTTQTGSIITNSNFTGLSDANSSNATDFGFYGKYVESSTTKYAGVYYDASVDNTFKFFCDTQTAPTTTVNESATGYALANVQVAGLTVGGTIANTSGDLTLDVAGDITLDADGGDVRLKDNGTEFLNFYAGTIERTGSLIFDVSGNITLNADGSTISLSDGSLNFGQFYQNASGALNIYAPTQDKDIVFLGNDGGSTVTALTLDMSAAGEAIFNSDIRLFDSKAVRFGTDQDFRISNDGSHTTLQNSTADQDILIKGNDGGSTITALTLDMSNAGKATFSGIVSSAQGFERGDMFITQNEIDVSSGDLLLDVAGTIKLDADNSGTIYLQDAGNIYGIIEKAGSDLRFRSGGQDADIVFMGNDGGSLITALRLDMSQAGEADFNSAVKVAGGIVAHQTNRGVLEYDSNVFKLRSYGATSGSGSITLSTGGGGNSADTVALTLDSNQDATFAGTIALGDTKHIFLGAGNDGRISFDGNNTLNISAANGTANTVNITANNFEIGGANTLISGVANDSVVINEDSGNISFRVESNNNTSMLFVDGTNDKVGIGTSAPASLLNLSHATAPELRFSRTGTGQQWIQSIDSSGRLLFLEAASTGGTLFTRMSIDDTGEVGIGVTPIGGIALNIGNNVNSSAVTRVSNGTVHVDLTASSSGKAFLEVGTNHPLVLATNATEQMRIDTSGNVGIGTTAPNQWASYTDNGATVFQVRDTSQRARVVINGGNGAHLDLVDYAGGTNDKHMNMAVDGGVLKFGSLNDAGNAFVQNNILVMDLGTGAIKFNDAFTFPTADGSAGQVLKTDGSGNLTFQNDSGGGSASSSISDSDGDTKIQVEESSDEDIIRFDAGGEEVARMQHRNNEVFLDLKRRGVNSYANLSFSGMGLNTNTPAGYHPLVVQVGGAEKFRVHSNGNVGIGDSSPDYKLDIIAATDDGINIQGTRGFLRWNSGDMEIRNEGSYAMGFRTYDGSSALVERMRITSAGKVGIGTTAPSSILTVDSGTVDDVYTPTAFNDKAQIKIDVASTQNNYAGIQFTHSGNTEGFIGLVRTSTNVNDADFVIQGYSSATSAYAEKMRITDDGKVGIGTATPGSTLDVTVNGDKRIVLNQTGASQNSGLQLQYAGTRTWDIYNTGYAATPLHFYSQVAGASTMTLTTSGNVGIGTTAPSKKLHVKGTSDDQIIIDSNSASANSGLFFFENGTNKWEVYHRGADNTFRIYNYNTSAADFVIDSAGDVGIGETNPVQKLQVNGNIRADGHYYVGGTAVIDSNRRILAADGAANVPYITFAADTNTGLYRPGADILGFSTAGSERARIDASGNFMVGKTTQGLANAGFEIAQTGQATATQSGASALRLNRLASDGEILQFRKASATVGNIATVDGDLTIFSSASGHKGLRFGNGYIAPTTNSTAVEDNTVDLGLSTHRFKDLHLSGTANVGGNLVVTGDLTINGTTTTLNTATLNVEDKNITLNYGSGDTSSTADGAGITIQDAVNSSTDASFTWRASDDKFISSHPIRAFGGFELPDSNKLFVGDGNDLQIYHDGSNSYIKNNTGWLNMPMSGNGVSIANGDFSEQIAKFVVNGACELYHNGSKKFETTSTGVSITGKTTFSDDITVGHSTTGTHSTSTSATTQVTIASFTKTVFRSAKYLVQVTNATDSTYHTTEILVIHDGTDTYMTEYGSMFTGSAAEATFTSDVTGGGAVRLLATPASTDSMTFKVIRQNITV